MRKRVALFVLLCIGAAALPIGYAVWSRAPIDGDKTVKDALEVDDPQQLAAIQSRPHILFINKQPGAGYGRIAVVPLDAVDGPRYLTPLECEHAYFAGGVGLCLTTDRHLIATYYAYRFDADFTQGARIALQGYPSRVRVSPDGRLGAITVFVRGDSYATGAFSTRTTLIEMGTGQQIADLEDFAAFRKAEHFKEPDFNYWGVTFPRVRDRFYATLATGGRLFLVEGSLNRREVRTILEGVECPSLSPDDARIVFKSRRQGNGRSEWALRVLTLDSLTENDIPEPRSVDDQATWLDAEHILYALPHEVASAAAVGSTNIWSARADGTEAPHPFLKHAYSPSIVTPAPIRSARLERLTPRAF